MKSERLKAWARAWLARDLSGHKAALDRLAEWERLQVDGAVRVGNVAEFAKRLLEDE